MAEQKQDDQLEHTYGSYARIQDVAPKTCQKRWTIGRSVERGSGISVLATRHDDDDDEEDTVLTEFSILETRRLIKNLLESVYCSLNKKSLKNFNA